MATLGAVPAPPQQGGSEGRAGDDGSDLSRRRKAQGRKRTKTGCLTCRKRRIKCGEERPTCQNCVKSKRVCEGYNKKVVFKEPINSYRPSVSAASSSFQVAPSSIRNSEVGPHSQATSRVSQTTPIDGRGQFGSSIELGGQNVASNLNGNLIGRGQNAHNYSGITASTAPLLERKPFPSDHRQDNHDVDTIDESHLPEPRNRPSPPSQPHHYDFDALIKQERSDPHRPIPARLSTPEWSASSPSTFQPYTTERFFEFNRQAHSELPVTQTYSLPPTQDSAEAISASVNNGFRSLGPGSSVSNSSGTPETEARGATSRDAYDQSVPPQPRSQLRSPLEEVSRPGEQDFPSSEYQDRMDDDDPYDVTDDEDNDMDYNPGGWHDYQDTHLRDNDLGIVVALQARQNHHNLSPRTCTSFLNGPNMLAHYVPSPQSTPLQDPVAARIFCHFVNVTAPTISMFERHPANPSLIFQGAPVPKSQQHIWTYTFPTLALQSPALLHAILALASLHIAKIQNGSLTASLKHYAYGLRRVAKNVSTPSRRRHPATLAAAMLLAFYECWSADHQKWSNHLLGARQLFKEVDFIGMARAIKRRSDLQQQQDQAKYYQAMQLGSSQIYNERSQSLIPLEVDENIVSIIMGRKVSTDPYDSDAGPDSNWHRQYSDKDIETFETQRDLFWWYCKQDAYQGILGGGRLFMEYSIWSHCPPRAPIGRLNATYGTFDHLILLLGRLADFSAKDLKRKRLVMKANGGQWQPPEAMRAHAPPPPPPGAPRGPPPSIPPFSGMVPDVHEPTLPMGFSPDHSPKSQSQSPNSSSSNPPLDLHAQTLAAEEQWLSIRDAFQLLESHFGPDFQALGPEYSTPISTPFGPALQYRTYGIAGIWMNYYMGLISCHRSHPCMPPAAMMAAGIAARQTASLANELGRIAGGIAPDLNAGTHQVSPGMGAALVESSTCLFVSGVQYQDPEQRKWLVGRLKDIARLTGWQTSYAICMGCETAWIKAAEMGRGPLYVRDGGGEGRGRRGEGGGMVKVPDMGGEGRRIDRAMEGKGGEERRAVWKGSDRAHYALGVLSFESDFEGLDLDGDSEGEGGDGAEEIGG